MAYEGDFVATLCHFAVVFDIRGDFGCTFGQLWAHFWRMRVPLGPLWKHFGVTLKALWGHFGCIRMTLGYFRLTSGSLWNDFGCTEVNFQKTLIFPIHFNDFIQLWE